MSNTSPILAKKSIHYFLNYISHFFFTIFACELLTVLIMLVTKTSLERIFVALISYTPMFGLWGQTNFDLGTKEVVIFVSFWSLIFTIVNNFLIKVAKIHINQRVSFIVFTLLHIVALYRLRTVDGFFLVICFLYGISLFSCAVYVRINRLARFIDN